MLSVHTTCVAIRTTTRDMETSATATVPTDRVGQDFKVRCVPPWTGPSLTASNKTLADGKTSFYMSHRPLGKDVSAHTCTNPRSWCARTYNGQRGSEMKNSPQRPQGQRAHIACTQTHTPWIMGGWGWWWWYNPRIPGFLQLCPGSETCTGAQFSSSRPVP